MNDHPEAVYIAVEQLNIGLYIHLDLSWFEHSFTLNSFLIKDIEQIQAIKQLGLKKIRIDPKRSKAEPLPIAKSNVADIEAPPPSPALTPEEVAAIAAKMARVERLNKIREAMAQCEKHFLKATHTLKNINRTVHARPEEAHQEADKLVSQMIHDLLAEKEVAIHLMNDKIAGEDVYYHSMNVAVLAMMLAKELGLSDAEIHTLGMGCVFHDIGKIEIPDRVLLKAEGLTRAEKNLFQQHSEYGVGLAERMQLSKTAREIILQHHENSDGSGYPRGLKGEEISRLASIVNIVNIYDNHCNSLNPADSLTPYEALSQMFVHQRRFFDEEQLSVFIRCMGIYPPGSLVLLSNQRIGMVVAVNSSQPLRPSVLVYDPDIPKNEALILDLMNEPEISVSSSLKAKQLTPEIYEYLSPRKRITYFFSTSHAKPGAH